MSTRSEAAKSYTDKLDRMGLGISTASTGAKAKGHAYPQNDGSQGTADLDRADGYESEAANEKMVAGKAPKPRLDRKPYRNGGAVKKGTTVNVIVAPQNKEEAVVPPPMPPMGGAPMPPPKLPPAPPMGAGGPEGMMPPMPRKHGGRVPHLTDGAGAGSGLGRLGKVKSYGDNAKPGKKASSG